MKHNTATPGQRAALRANGMDPVRVGRPRNDAVPTTKTVDGIEIPSDPTKLESMLQDPKTIRALFSEKGKFGEFVQAYATHVLNREQSITQQIKEETQRQVRDWLKEHGQDEDTTPRPNLSDPIGGGVTGARNTIHNPRAMGAVLDKEFSNSADYFQLIHHQRNRTAEDQAKIRRMTNAFSSTVPSEGGFLIPENLRAEMLRVSLETSIVRPRARVIPMETLRVPFPAVDATSNVSSVYGGIVGYWTEEGGQLTSSEAKFARIVLEAKKLTAYTQVPNELISDSGISFEAFINQIFPEALGFYEDDAFLNGSGVGMPLGVLDANNAAAISVTKEANQPAASIVWENIVKMFSRMLPGSLARGVWVASIDTFPQLATMALSVGTGGAPVWLNNGVQGPPATILGRPVIFTEKASTLGTAGDISFIDFGFYLIGDRQVMSAMSSPHFRFQNDETAYRIIERVDGVPWLKTAITPKNNGATLSPFVKLETRS